MMNMGAMGGGWTMMAGMAALARNRGRTRRKSSIVDSLPAKSIEIPIAQRSQSWQQLSCGSVPSPGNEQLRFAGWAFSPQVTEVAVWICRFAPGAGRTVFARRQ